jgi:hypothetical protein
MWCRGTSSFTAPWAMSARIAEIWRVLKPGGLYQGTMLSKRDAQFGCGRPVAPDTFIRGSDPKAHPHYYCDLAGLAALFAGFELLAGPGGAAPTRLLALARPRRTAVNRDGRVTGAGERSSPLSIPRRSRDIRRLLCAVHLARRRMSKLPSCVHNRCRIIAGCWAVPQDELRAVGDQSAVAGRIW